MDSMPCGNCLDCLDTFRSDMSPSLGEGLETALKSKSHALEQASMGHVREGMPIQDPAKIRNKAQSPRDLPQAAKEDSGARNMTGPVSGSLGNPRRK